MSLQDTKWLAERVEDWRKRTLRWLSIYITEYWHCQYIPIPPWFFRLNEGHHVASIHSDRTCNKKHTQHYGFPTLMEDGLNTHRIWSRSKGPCLIHTSAMLVFSATDALQANSCLSWLQLRRWLRTPPNGLLGKGIDTYTHVQNWVRLTGINYVMHVFWINQTKQ